jgi:uncharacterized membrane protein (UPF0127 family)
MRSYPLILTVMVLTVVLSGCMTADDPDDNDDSGLYQVTFDENGNELLLIKCEMAITDEERRTGLMNRTEMAIDRGMVFNYDPPREVFIWMKNTNIPLDIVFVSPDFEVIRVYEADPGVGIPDDQLEIYPSNGVSRYVIEMNQGLAAENGIGPGTGVTVWGPF